MGTRYGIRVYDGQELLLNLYGNWDGYPSYLGRTLAHWLQDMEVVNGYMPEQRGSNYIAAGPECLAAQIVAKLKHGLGSVFLVSVNELDDNYLDYTYTIRCGTTCGVEPITIMCQAPGWGVEYYGPPRRLFDHLTQ